MESYYRTKFLSYGSMGHSRQDAVRRQVEFIKKIGVEAFVVDAELYTDRRPLWRRLLAG